MQNALLEYNIHDTGRLRCISTFFLFSPI